MLFASNLSNNQTLLSHSAVLLSLCAWLKALRSQTEDF